MGCLTLYTDGGARGNPGPSAYGFLIYDGDRLLYKEGKAIGDATNNTAEYSAIIAGLKKAREFGEKIKVSSDSELVVRQLKGQYKVKKPHLKELYKKAKEAESTFKEVNYIHRRREFPGQKEADALVNEALDNSTQTR